MSFTPIAIPRSSPPTESDTAASPRIQAVKVRLKLRGRFGLDVSAATAGCQRQPRRQSVSPKHKSLVKGMEVEVRAVRAVDPLDHQDHVAPSSNVQPPGYRRGFVAFSGGSWLLKSELGWSKRGQRKSTATAPKQSAKQHKRHDGRQHRRLKRGQHKSETRSCGPCGRDGAHSNKCVKACHHITWTGRNPLPDCSNFWKGLWASAGWLCVKLGWDAIQSDGRLESDICC